MTMLGNAARPVRAIATPLLRTCTRTIIPHGRLMSSLARPPLRSLHCLTTRPRLLAQIPIYSTRQFRASLPRKDVFFCSIPAIKQGLLAIVRTTLIFLPLAWRWRLFERYPKAVRIALLPLVCFLCVVGLGLNQSPKTARWRLLLMTEREELEWAEKRFEEIVHSEEHLLLRSDDPRTIMVKQVCDRLVQALNDDSPLSCASHLREDTLEHLRATKRRRVGPSARTELATMPFLPESSNPRKIVQGSSFNIYIVDRPQINAFVLPSTDVFVYTGLLSVADDEDLLAAVLAHEISHCVERHIVEGLGFAALSGVAFDVLRGTTWALTLSFPFLGDALNSLFNFLDRQVGQRAYSRKLETEADALGLELMAKAGYDPQGAVTLWEILNEVERDVTENGEHGTITDHIALLRTHPTGEQRLEDLERHLPRARKLYQQALKDMRNREETKEAMAAVAAQGIAHEEEQQLKMKTQAEAARARGVQVVA